MTEKRVLNAMLIAVVSLYPSFAGCSKTSEAGGAESSSGSESDGSTGAMTQGDEVGTTAGSATSLRTDTSLLTDTSTGGTGDQELCDGSSEIRLVWTVHTEIPNSETQNPGEGLMRENGRVYFYVTGTCEFHVLGDVVDFGPDVAGVLTTTEADELAAAIHYSEWQGYYGKDVSWSGLHGGGSHALIGPGGLFRLGIDCLPHSVDLEECPEPFPSMMEAALAWEEKLREIGEPASGPMRVAAVLEEPPGYTGPADWEPWPLERPLADFVLEADAPIMAGQGVLLDDPEDVATMRAFRESFTGQFGSQDTIRALYIEDGGQHYLVYVRDTAPVEDEDGLVPWLDGEL